MEDKKVYIVDNYDGDYKVYRTYEGALRECIRLYRKYLEAVNWNQTDGFESFVTQVQGDMATLYERGYIEEVAYIITSEFND